MTIINLQEILNSILEGPLAAAMVLMVDRDCDWGCKFGPILVTKDILKRLDLLWR